MSIELLAYLIDICLQAHSNTCTYNHVRYKNAFISREYTFASTLKYMQPCMVTKFAYTTISNHMYLSNSILSSVLQIIFYFLHATDTHPSAL